MFGLDKWLEIQNNKLESTFNAAIRKLEALFSNDAQQQIESFKQNAMADYKELWSLREENQELSEVNQLLKDELINILDKLVVSNNSSLFGVTLSGGRPVITSEEVERLDFILIILIQNIKD